MHYSLDVDRLTHRNAQSDAGLAFDDKGRALNLQRAPGEVKR